MNDMYARIVCELPRQIARERAIELKKQQMRIRGHASRDVARVYAFTWTVLGDHPSPAEIHLLSNTFHQRFRAGDNRGDLKWTLQESLEK